MVYQQLTVNLKLEYMTMAKKVEVSVVIDKFLIDVQNGMITDSMRAFRRREIGVLKFYEQSLQGTGKDRSKGPTVAELARVTKILNSYNN